MFAKRSSGHLCRFHGGAASRTESWLVDLAFIRAASEQMGWGCSGVGGRWDGVGCEWCLGPMGDAGCKKMGRFTSGQSDADRNSTAGW